MRYEDGVYVPLTLLIDRAVNPTKTIEGINHELLKQCRPLYEYGKESIMVDFVREHG